MNQERACEQQELQHLWLLSSGGIVLHLDEAGHLGKMRSAGPSRHLHR